MRRTGCRELERVADAPLDAESGVHRTLRGDLVRRADAQRATLADVRTLGVLADHDEVVRRVPAGRGSDERSLVDVQVEIEAHLEQQAALDDAGWNLGGADRAEQDAVEGPQLVERRVGEDLAVAEVALPPRSNSVVSMSTPAARTTLTASAVTSGPMPSPPITAMLCVVG